MSLCEAERRKRQRNESHRKSQRILSFKDWCALNNISEATGRGIPSDTAANLWTWTPRARSVKGCSTIIWRKLRTGPPFVTNGLTPIYNIHKARQWLAAGGTAGVRKAGAKRAPRIS
jgi:hypothetical protein